MMPRCAKFRRVLALAGLALITPLVAQAGEVDRCGAGRRGDEDVARAAGITVELLSDLRDIRDLTNDDICTLDQKKLDRSIYRVRIPKPDKPGEWARFRAMEQSSDDGEVRPDGLLNGLAGRHEMLRAIEDGRARREAAGLKSTDWKSLGPANIGGRIRAIAFHPTIKGKLWVGSATGGIWVSENSGASWNSVDDFWGSLAVATIAIDPVQPDILYAGTGEGFFGSRYTRGAGIFKSTDGGKTWGPLSATDPKKDKGWFHINRIAIDPSNPKVVLAATLHGIYRSEDAGASWTQVQKLLRTVNGRQYTTPIYDLDIDPFDSNRVIGGSGFGYYFVSTDNGKSFETRQITENLVNTGRLELAFAKSKKGVVYGSFDLDVGQVYRSDDGGATFALVSTPKHLGNQGWYDNAIWVDPTNHDHLIVGGINLYRSTDGGKTFGKISHWQFGPTHSHADNHAIVSPPDYKPGSNPVVYFGNDGGLYRANVEKVALKSGWEILNNGLAITQFYGVAVSTDGKVIIGGTQDNGTVKRIAETSNWSTIASGDGGIAHIDPTDSRYRYGSIYYLGIFRYVGDDSGHYICQGISEGYKDLCKGNNLSNFIAPFILDPGDPKRVYAGGASLWVTDDAHVADKAPVWRAIKEPMPEQYNYIKSMAMVDGTSDIVWLGYNKGNIAVSRDGAKTWKSIDIGPKRNVLRILIDKADHNRVFVGFGGFNEDNLYMTTDGGVSWKDISGSLPAVPVRAIARNPKRPDWLYVGTEVGLFTSEDSGKTWSTTNDGPGNVSVDELVWVGDDTLIAATFGRGVFEAKISVQVAGGGGNDGGGRGDGRSGDDGGSDGASGDGRKRKCSVNDIVTGKTGC